MLFLIVLLVLALVFGIAAMRWGYDSRDRVESKEWARRNEQVWSEGHRVVRPIKQERVVYVVRPALKQVHASQPYGI